MTIIRTVRASVVPAIAAMAAATALSTLEPVAAAPASPALSGLTAQTAEAVPGSMAARIERVQYTGPYWREEVDEEPGWTDSEWDDESDVPSVSGPVVSETRRETIVVAQNDDPDAWDRCEATFQSFRPSDGTYQPYGDVPRQMCPYLVP